MNNDWLAIATVTIPMCLASHCFLFFAYFNIAVFAFVIGYIAMQNVLNEIVYSAALNFRNMFDLIVHFIVEAEPGLNFIRHDQSPPS